MNITSSGATGVKTWDHTTSLNFGGWSMLASIA